LAAARRPIGQGGGLSAFFRAAAAFSRRRRRPLPQSLDELYYDLALANRMVANEGVLDAFGHISVRHPGNPEHYLLSRSRAPELIEPSDILEFTLDSEPVREPSVRLYGERVIHGEIYKARPDVMAVWVRRRRSGTSATISAIPIFW
jgi:ribulose-5-phosphate 4-epimerase/fuculose-1-phosphate aldolase